MNETLAQLSNVLVYSCMLVYVGAVSGFVLDLAQSGEAAARQRRAQKAVAAGVAGAAGTGSAGGVAVSERTAVEAPRPRKAVGVAIALTWLAFLLHLGGVVTRGLSASRVPWGNMYEFAISGSMVVTGVFLVALLRREKRDLRYLGTFVVAPVLLTVLVAVVTLYTDSAPLVPALQSYWLVIHVSVAFIASALFTMAFSANILQLVQDRREALRAAGSEPVRGRFMDALPSAKELDRTAYRLIAISFPMWTFTLVAGAIWAEVSWGRYWNWDPKEVWTFVIWVVYAAYLHARATGGWNGRRATYLALAGYACVLINFGVVNVFFPGNHSYAGIG